MRSLTDRRRRDLRAPLLRSGGWLLLGLLGALALAGCDGERGEARAWISRCARASERAARAEARGEEAEAERALLEIAQSEPPMGVAARDARILRQDARARLARALLRRGRPREALREAEAGIALGLEVDLFGATLLDLRGRAHEALGRDREAARDYHRAQQINESLLEGLLEGSPRPAGERRGP